MSAWHACSFLKESLRQFVARLSAKALLLLVHHRLAVNFVDSDGAFPGHFRSDLMLYVTVESHGLCDCGVLLQIPDSAEFA
jgi:hypothetical protein